jgi:hypothetical protein
LISEVLGLTIFSQKMSVSPVLVYQIFCDRLRAAPEILNLGKVQIDGRNKKFFPS